MSDSTFPDERLSPLEHSGDVDCFICGAKVNVLKAYEFRCSAGPSGWMHSWCCSLYGHDPHGLWLKYNATVIEAATNFTSAPSERRESLLSAISAPAGGN